MIKEGIEKEGVSRTFLCLELAHQAVAASAGLLSRRLCPGSCLDKNYLEIYRILLATTRLMILMIYITHQYMLCVSMGDCPHVKKINMCHILLLLSIVPMQTILYATIVEDTTSRTLILLGQAIILLYGFILLNFFLEEQDPL